MLKKIEQWLDKLEGKLDKLEKNLDDKAEQFDRDIASGKHDLDPDKPIKLWQAFFLILFNLAVVYGVAKLASIIFTKYFAFFVTIGICGFWLLIGLGMIFTSKENSFRLTGAVLLLTNAIIFYYQFY